MEYKKYKWGKPGLLNVTPNTIENSSLPPIEKARNLQEILELPNESFEVCISLYHSLLNHRIIACLI